MRMILAIWGIIGVSLGMNGQSATATLQPTKIMIGDYIDLDIKVKNPAQKPIIYPKIEDGSIGNFSLVEKQKSDTLYSGNEMIVHQKYIITCFEDSLQTFPALHFASLGGDSFFTNPIPIQVTSPNVDSAKEIKPIKTIINVPLSEKEIFSYLFLSAILLGLVLLLYWIYIKYIRKEALFDSEKKANPPHVEALQSLKNIEMQNLWQRGNVAEYYDGISDTIRLYIEKRFGIKALEQTTAQILQKMSALELPENIYASIEELLHLSDLAKFAKENPSREDNEKIMSVAYRFVQDTQMIYDSNKKANTGVVRKFYAQNQYRLRPQAINQKSFRILVYGISTTLLTLSILILLAYKVPIPLLLNWIADKPAFFFLFIVGLGIAVTLLILWIVRRNETAFSLYFDYDAVFIKTSSRTEKWLFSDILEVNDTPKGDLELMSKTSEKQVLSRYIEFFSEVRERLKDAHAVELQLLNQQ